MNRFLKKVKTLIKRRRLSKKIGLKFTRAAAWKLPEKVLIKNKTIKLNLINDGSTSTSFADIFLDDVYGLYFFKSFLPEVKTIADIGANQGLFALAASNVFDAQVHAYEPNPVVFKYLKAQSGFMDAVCFNEAVGLINGRISIQAGKDSLHGQTRLSGSGNIVQVSFDTVISRMNGNIDLLKLDCEGAEWEILKDKISLGKVRAVTLEYHLDDAHDHNSIKEVLRGAGFEILHYEVAGPSWGMVWAINKNYKT